MEATVELSELKKALTAVRGGVSKRGHLPILTGAKLTATDNGVLTITTTDIDMTCQIEIPATVSSPGDAVVPHQLFTKLMPKGNGKKAGSMILRTKDDDVLEAENGSTAQLRTMDLSQWPKLPDFSSSLIESYPLDPKVLAAVLPAVSDEDSRPILTCMYLTAGEVVGTDSYRLHVAQVDENYPNLLVPGRVLGEVAKYGQPAMLHVAKVGTKRMTHTKVDESEKDKPNVREVERSTWDGKPYTDYVKDEEVTDWSVHFKITAGDRVWYCREQEGSFPPNYRELIPTSSPFHLHMDRAAAIEAVEHVKALVRDPTTPVRIKVTATEAEFTVVTQDWGTSTQKVPAIWIREDNASGDDGEKVVGDEITIAFNPTYLIACLKGTGDRVIFDFIDELKPAVISDVEPTGPKVQRLLMPVRIS